MLHSCACEGTDTEVVETPADEGIRLNFVKLQRTLRIRCVVPQSSNMDVSTRDRRTPLPKPIHHVLYVHFIGRHNSTLSLPTQESTAEGKGAAVLL